MQFSPDGYWMWNGTQWVPNPYRPTGAPPVAAAYESAGFRSRVTVILLGVNILGLVLLIGFDAVDALFGQGNPRDTVTILIGLDALIAAVTFYGSLIAAITFFSMWLHRTVRNMPALGSPDPRLSPGRAVGFCFIPILNLFNPFYSVLDAWRGSDSSRRWLDIAARKQVRGSFLLSAWWIAWLVGGVLSRVAFGMSGASGDEVDVVANVVVIAAALLAILVVRDVTARQEHKNELIASGQLV